MSGTSNEEIIAQWRDEPAPLLPVLHAFHDRDGSLSDEALHEVSEGLNIPIAELFGTVTFYHHFSRAPDGRNAPRVCTGSVCCLQGGREILAALKDRNAIAMPCAGRCDEPVPVIQGNAVAVGINASALSTRPSPLPPPNPGGVEECVFSKIREPGRSTLDGYRATGGYEGLTRAVKDLTPEEVIDLIAESKLAGRGGAGFPTGTKWKAVREADGTPKAVICNADEGEPGCFKDRALLEHDPHAVIEGMVIAARATGAELGIVYLRYEYPEIQHILERAITTAEAGGFVGDNVLGSGMRFRLCVRRGAGAYICGEEGSLLNSLEGKHPFPRNRPPFPVTHGFDNRPTAVNNVETLASVPHILLHGAGWYAGLGQNGQAGTKVISLSGDIQRPGNYEVPLGMPLKTLLEEWAGGAPEGRTIQAVTMAGLSGGFLGGDDLNVNLDEPSVREKGSMLGAAGIIVFDDSRDMVEMAHEAMEFFADESCGKCFPCRIGTQRLKERLDGPAACNDLEDWNEEVRDIGDVMRSTSACGLGMAAPLITDSLVKYFPNQVEKRWGKG